MIEYENLNKANEKFFAEYQKKFSSMLQSGWYILGGQVSKFEHEFAEYCGVQHCIGVASGLDALILAIDAFDFDKGSEIIVPSNTYIATILAIIRNGLKPVLVEPELLTYNIDADAIAEKITSKTKAIIAVHLYGKLCNMNAIMELAKNKNIAVIEDAAQAHGASFAGKKAGSFGAGCFSFYPTKNLGALGDAGAITTDDFKLAEKLRSLRNYGSSKKYYNDYAGYNSRLDELQAGFLSVKLKALDDITNHKRKLANVYLNRLSSEFIKPHVDDSYFDVYHIFNIRHKKRDALKEYLLQNEIKTEIHYPLPPHKQKAMQGILSGEYPISEEIHNTTLSLPISYFHSEDDVIKVCEVINGWSP